MRTDEEVPAVSTTVLSRGSEREPGRLDRPGERLRRSPGPPLGAQPVSGALHRTRRTCRVLAPWLAVAGALVWFVTLRPVALGGPAGFVVVAGTSMEPLYRTGDLVLTWRADSYRTGDVVAFGIPDSRARVIHRIVGGDAEAGYVLRGDNKPEEDLWRPTPDDVLGRAVVHVPHLGAVTAALRSQTALAVLAGAFAFLAVAAPAGDRAEPRRDAASTGGVRSGRRRGPRAGSVRAVAPRRADRTGAAAAAVPQRPVAVAPPVAVVRHASVGPLVPTSTTTTTTTTMLHLGGRDLHARPPA